MRLGLLWFINTLLTLFLLVSVLVNSIELWRVWSLLGEEELYMALSLILYYLYFDSSRVLIVLVSVVLSGSVNVFLKYLLGLPRPPDPLVPVEGPGFPSGHAQVSTSFWFTLSGVRRERVMYITSSILVAGVSLSRVYLKAHYLPDVIGGVLLGLLVYCAVMLLDRVLGLTWKIVCAVSSIGLSTVSYFTLSAPSGTCSVLVATSVAILVYYLVLEKWGFKPEITSTLLRVILLILSLVVVYTSHLVTRGELFITRTILMFCAVFFALSLPVAVGFLKIRVH